MKPNAPRSFSSLGRVSRPALFGGVALITALAITSVLAARAEAGSDREGATDAARRVLVAANEWRLENAEGCPTLTELVEAGHLPASARTDDVWGGRLRVVCRGDQTSVLSAGPDGRPGTDDDVTVDLKDTPRT